ncbi:MAG: MTH938/NDUFAF3 family protein [Candidatus Njordarchaeia archaeon]|nr:hypothetical protein [Candidatus Korarchaeota archaeon]
MQISTKFGQIRIGEKIYNFDVIVTADLSIIKRPKYLSKHKKKQYGHTPLTKEEIEYILNLTEKPEIIIIGCGQYGSLPIEEEAKELLRSLKINVIIQKTPEAIQTFSNYVKRKNILGIFHVTC